MAARSIASLSLSFGLVSIPVRLFSATESASSVRFNLLAKDGSRVKQQYVSEKDQTIVERRDMVKGYEFEKDQFVIFTPEELKAMEEGARHTIDIVAFIPEKAVDPLFYDKAYFLAPDKRGGKPYSLLMAAMRESGRCALAKWAWEEQAVRRAGARRRRRTRAAATAVRRRGALDERPRHRDGRGRAVRTEARAAADRPDLRRHVRPEPVRRRGEGACPGGDRSEDRGPADRRVERQGEAASSNVIDLMDALRASLQGKTATKAQSSPAGDKAPTRSATVAELPSSKERKPIRRAAKVEAVEAPAAAPARARAKK